MPTILPVLKRAALLLCAVLLLGTAFAQGTLLDVPVPSDDAGDGPRATPQPTVEPVVPPEDGLGRFNPDSPEPPVPPVAAAGLTRNTFDPDKLDPVLAELMTPALLGDLIISDEITRGYYLPQDKRGRYRVIVWGGGITGKRLSGKIEKLGGVVEFAESNAAYAKLTPLQIATLSLEPKVALIQPQPVARIEQEETSAQTRDPAGPNVSEGFDVVNAQVWHEAGNTGGTAGSAVKIAVIDFGFGTSTSANTDLTCLNSYPNVTLAFGSIGGSDPRRGLDMAEVICDIAPGSRIRLYKVSTSDDLYDAINAADNTNDIIVIGADFGANFSPGDGTFGRSSSKNVYQALATAKALGVTVIAASGNSTQAYKAFTYTSGSATLPITARPGDQVNISWNDWPANPHPSGGAQEDLTVSLSGAGFSAIPKPGRAGGAPPAHQFVVPSNCTLSGSNCQNLQLNFSALTGNAGSVVVQVSVTGGFNRALGAPNGTATAFPDHGTLSRPSDSPDVIAVGAVCADFSNNFPALAYSGHGPIYDPGGGFIDAPAGILPPGYVKPEVAGPTNVSVNGSFVSAPCDSGLRGTQGAAAHIAGVVALMRNNTLVDGFRGLNAPNNHLHYLRSHAVDLPFGASANGYDQIYGAGLTVLGMPDFDYDISLAAPVFAPPNRLPIGACTGADAVVGPGDIVYVGPRQLGPGDMNGSIAAPYQSIVHAANIQQSSGEPNRCVVVLPGEYSSPLHLAGLSNTVGIYGYEGVTLSGSAGATTLVIQNKYWGQLLGIFTGRAGIYVEEGSNTTVGGFEFRAGTVLNDGAFYRAQVLAVDSADDFTFTRSAIDGITTNRTLIEVFNDSTGVTIADNRITNNTGEAGASLIAVSYSGSDTSRITISGNLIEGNLTNVSGWDIEIAPFETLTINWVPLIRSLESYTDIVNNTIRLNTAEVLIQGVTRTQDTPHELRLLGNAIVANTLQTGDLGLAHGPMIHGFYQRWIMAVNNTIAGNTFTQGPPYNIVFGRGDDDDSNGGAPNNGSLTTVYARWELRGNLIYANTGAGQLVADTDPQFAVGGGCIDFAGNADRGTRRNWIFDGGQLGNCGPAVIDVTNNNITADPLPKLLGGTDPTIPAFYSFANASAPEPNGIDDGPDAFLLSDLPDFAAGADARGGPRRTDGDLDATVAVDIGAFEFTQFILQASIPITANEDSGTVEFDVNDPAYIQGGFPPYTATILNRPIYYGTHCDNRFASPTVQGAAVEYIDAQTLTIAYCPPRHFHTDTLYSTFNPAGAGMTVQIRDAAGNQANTTVGYTINPTDDSVLASTLGDNVPAGDVINTAAGIGLPAASNPVRLRPYADFAGGFVFSEANNPVVVAARSEADYDFGYPSMPVLVADPGNNNPSAIMNNLAWSSQQRGILGVNLTGVAAPAQAKVQYTVQDQRGGSVTNIMTIKAVVPPGPFTQTLPVNGFTVTSLDTFTGFSWTESANAQTYDLRVERQAGAAFVPALQVTGLTPAADADGLACASGSCTFTPNGTQLQALAGGTFRWTATADNEGYKVNASNAPFSLIVQHGSELIVNGDFELQGAASKDAANWSLKNGNKDKRKCGDGIDGTCSFQFKGDGLSAKLKQKPVPSGRAGDTMTASAFFAPKGMPGGSGSIKYKIKYTNGDKDTLTLNVPGGGDGTFPAAPEEQALTLRGAVNKIVVIVAMKPGGGKFHVDNVGLRLQEQSAFALLTPGDDETIVGESGYITEFTWQPSALASSYHFKLTRTSDLVTVIDASGLTAAADGDSLTCALGECRYTLASPLANADYIWTVTASNGATAVNAPFNLTVDTANLHELAENGTFEDVGGGVPKKWKDSGLKKSAAVCTSGDKHPEYQGACAFQFKGAAGLSAKLTQKLDTAGLTAGSRLTLRAAAQLGAAIAGAEAKLQVKYSDGSKENVKITLPGGTFDWTAFASTPLTVTGIPVASVKVTLSYKGGAGSVMFDNVSVLRD